MFEIHRKKGLRIIGIKGHDKLCEWEPSLKRSKKKYAGGFYLPDNMNVDTYDFGKRIIAKSEKMGARVSQGCAFEKFVFKKNTKNIIGVKTSKGVLPCDNVFICGGIYSPYMVDKIGLRLPVSPLGGYSFTMDKKDAHDFKYGHLDYNNKI